MFPHFGYTHSHFGYTQISHIPYKCLYINTLLKWRKEIAIKVTPIHTHNRDTLERF
jgi:hypothetical protein